MKKVCDQSVNKRRLKVTSKFFSRNYSTPVIFPEIRLCGKWLQDIGFNCGEIVTVDQQENKIIISIESK
jgi:toxic protein SymE